VLRAFAVDWNTIKRAYPWYMSSLRTEVHHNMPRVAIFYKTSEKKNNRSLCNQTW